MTDFFYKLVVPLLAAVVGGLFSVLVYHRTHARRKLRLREYPMRNLTQELEKSGLDFNIIKGGVVLDSVFQKICVATNSGKVGLSEVEIVCQGLEGTKVVGASYFTDNAQVEEPMVRILDDGSKLSLKILNLKQNASVQLSFYATGNVPKLRIG